MKRTLHIKTLIFAVLGAFILISCSEDMNYLHEKYTQNGEITYAENPDSVFFTPGYYRIKVAVRYPMPKNLSKCFIYWDGDNGRDSAVLKLPTGQQGVVTVDTILSGMKEKTTVFTIRTLDRQGNWSVPVTFNGAVWGENYRNGLPNRIINDVKAFHPSGKDSIYIYWTLAPTASDSTVLYYKSSVTGLQVAKTVSKKNLVTRLGDYKWGIDTLKRVTFYNKNTALDLFQTNVAKLKPDEFLLPKNTFVAKVLSQDQANSGATNYSYMWNDSLSLRIGADEITNLFKKTDNKIYSFTIDMGVTTNLTKLVLYPHPQNITSMLRKFEVWGNTLATWTSTSIKPTDADPTWPNEMMAKGWKLLRTVDLSMSIASSAPVVVTIDPTINVRYLRIRSLDTFNSDGKTTALSEIEAFTNVIQ